MTPMTQSKRAISLRFTREVRDLIENSVGEADLELEVKGHEYSLLVNGKKFPFEYSPVIETDQHVLIGAPLSNGQVEMQVMADVTHSSAIKRVLSEEDRARYRNKVQEAEKARKSRTTALVDAKQIQEFEKQAKAARKKPQRRTQQKSPALSRTRASPKENVVSSSSQSSAALSRTEVQGLKRRLMHFLATGTFSLEDIYGHLEARSQERSCIVQLLDDVAAPIMHGTSKLYTLSLECYEDLDIQGWKYTAQERERATEKAKRAQELIESITKRDTQTTRRRATPNTQSRRRASSTDDERYPTRRRASSASSNRSNRSNRQSSSTDDERHSTEKDDSRRPQIRRNSPWKVTNANDHQLPTDKANTSLPSSQQSDKRKNGAEDDRSLTVGIGDGKSSKSSKANELPEPEKRPKRSSDTEEPKQKKVPSGIGIIKRSRAAEVDSLNSIFGGIKRSRNAEVEESVPQRRDAYGDTHMSNAKNPNACEPYTEYGERSAKRRAVDYERDKASKIRSAEQALKLHSELFESQSNQYLSPPAEFTMEKITNDDEYAKWSAEMQVAQQLYREHKESLLKQGVLEQLRAVVYDYRTDVAREMLYFNHLADKTTKIHKELLNYYNMAK